MEVEVRPFDPDPVAVGRRACRDCFEIALQTAPPVARALRRGCRHERVAGRHSIEIATPVAVSDPFLVPTIVHVMLSPTSTGFGEPTFVPPRSMSVR